MKEDAPSHEQTSRRNFTKAIVTAAVAAPIVATVACSKATETNSTSRANATPTSDECELRFDNGNGFKKISWERQPPEDHIPPMGIEGGGSLIIDSKNLFRESGSGTGPYTYDEDPSIGTGNRYGDIKELTIITETSTEPYLSHSFYNSIQPGAQLWIWYQNLKPTPVGDDTDYDGIGAEPDLKLNGGRGVNGFKIFIRRKKLDYDKSHRKNRPHRYRHVNINTPPERHFRIAKWQVLNSANTVMFEDSGADNYRLYVTFGHYQ